MQLPRMFKTALLAAALVAAVALISPQQIGVIVYKIALVVLAGVAGYALDRALFSYARPHEFAPAQRAATSLEIWLESRSGHAECGRKIHLYLWLLYPIPPRAHRCGRHVGHRFGAVTMEWLVLLRCFGEGLAHGMGFMFAVLLLAVFLRISGTFGGD